MHAWFLFFRFFTYGHFNYAFSIPYEFKINFHSVMPRYAISIQWRFNHFRWYVISGNPTVEMKFSPPHWVFIFLPPREDSHPVVSPYMYLLPPSSLFLSSYQIGILYFLDIKPIVLSSIGISGVCIARFADDETVRSRKEDDKAYSRVLLSSSVLHVWPSPPYPIQPFSNCLFADEDKRGKSERDILSRKRWNKSRNTSTHC